MGINGQNALYAAGDVAKSTIGSLGGSAGVPALVALRDREQVRRERISGGRCLVAGPMH
jgi:hypothetical protein